LIIELIIVAKRFGKKTTAGITIKIFEKELGVQAGMTRETVSREMKLLKQQGLIKLEKNILTIPDLRQLEALMEVSR